jgi:AcrR family transcriptional regulator
MSSNLAVEEKLDPRVVRTRDLLGKAFIEVLAEKGFQAISVQDITERAGVNRTTFYLHFPDKYAMVDFIISQMFVQEIEKRTLNMCHYTLDNLRSLILVVCEFLSHLHHRCPQHNQQFESLAEAQIKKQVYALLAHWLEKAKTPIAIEIPATVATWAIYGLASYYSQNKNHPTLDQFVDEALPLVAVNLEQFA